MAHPIRHAKRAATALACLTALVYTATIWFHITRRDPSRNRVEICAGYVSLSRVVVPGGGVPGPVQWDAGPHNTPMQWRPSAFRRGAWSGVVIPLWMILLPLSAGAGLLWYLDRPSLARNRPGHCRRCGYDLAGLRGGDCPECGTVLRPLWGCPVTLRPAAQARPA